MNFEIMIFLMNFGKIMILSFRRPPGPARNSWIRAGVGQKFMNSPIHVLCPSDGRPSSPRKYKHKNLTTIQNDKQYLLDVLLEHCCSAWSPAPFLFLRDENRLSRWSGLGGVQGYIFQIQISFALDAAIVLFIIAPRSRGPQKTRHESTTTKEYKIPVDIILCGSLA